MASCSDNLSDDRFNRQYQADQIDNCEVSLSEENAEALFGVVVGGVLLLGSFSAFAITWLKGKKGLAILGFWFGIAWLFGAFLLAKPDSWWARKFYTSETLALAKKRYPEKDVKKVRLEWPGR